jgi:signal recognition particle GTPase
MFTKATKRAVKARVALDGPTGSGKTWTALTWAKVLGKRTALVDTERGSASLYSDHFDFDVLEMTPPYEPKRLIEALNAAEADGYDVVIVDRLSTSPTRRGSGRRATASPAGRSPRPSCATSST